MSEIYTPNNPSDFQFNPDGALWRVSRERMILLGGPQALLKQLAYPPVAEALRHTGRLEATPLQRLRTNAESGFSLIFGTVEGNAQINNRINALHRDPDLQLELTETIGAHIKGTKFSPRTQEGLGLVGATLIEGSVEGYRRFVGELPEPERDEYVSEAKTLFEGMGLRRETLPETYNGVRQHVQKMLDEDKLAVGSIALELAPYTMLAHSPIKKLVTSYMRMVTYDMLPDKLRRQYGYKITRGQRRFVERSASAIRNTVPYMPDVVRYNPQYRKAREIPRDSRLIFDSRRHSI